MSKLTYSEKLRDPRWQRKRLEVMQRDQFACKMCYKEDKTLHVHHCFYERGEPWDIDSGLLITLCESCHEKRNEMDSQIRRLIGRYLARVADLSCLEIDIMQLEKSLNEESEITHFVPHYEMDRLWLIEQEFWKSRSCPAAS